MKKRWFILILAILTAACGSDTGEKPVQFDPDKPPLDRLSDYHFFRGDLQELQPNDRVLPFDVNTALFSDYAEKQRFVWMPAGKSGTYHDSTAFDLPVGTVLIKNFYFPENFRDKTGPRRLIETRLLVHASEGWQGLPYIWNEEQTEAYLRTGGGEKSVGFINTRGEPVHLNYLIPNANQCRSCHLQDDRIVPIGTAARHLNKIYPYEEGTQNQLERWHQEGYLKDLPDPEAAPRLSDAHDPSSGTIEMRARAYLDINCSHCHNPSGPARTSGLFLRYDVTRPTALGIMKPPVAAGRGSGGRFYSIVPGNPDGSILLSRVESTEPGIMMPELGRTVVDEEAVQLIREWIKGMER